MATGNKPRWSDFADEELDDGGGGGDVSEELKYLLPPTQVIGPDKNGIKRVIEFKFNEQGQRVKVTTTSRVHKIVTRLKKQVLERRSSWTKFGDAKDEDVGARLTVVSTEEIRLERPMAPGAKESKAEEESMGKLGKRGAVLMLCRTCGKKGDHWTARCPYKDLSATGPEAAASLKPNEKSATDANSGTISKTGGRNYVPPSKRIDADQKGGSGSASDMRHSINNNHKHQDENAVKISNLSENVEEQDLRELFSVFGPVTRVHVVSDRQTGVKRGFGFVNFVHREDAKRAIQKLNGYGYDNLILAVEWASARSK